MYRFELTTDIAAPVSRVWQALCDPAEVAQWDSGVAEALDAPADYPRAGQHVTWRTTSANFPYLQDNPIEVIPQEKLRSLLSQGNYRMDETYWLRGDSQSTSLRLSVDLRVPSGGWLAERFWAGPRVRRGFEASMQGLKRWCEGRSTTDE